jgi:clan AA aspartic protease (TIGR02281 family)
VTGLGIAYEKLGKLPEAIQEYQAALSLQPDWYELHLKLAELFEQVGKLSEAADELEQVFHLALQAKATYSTAEFPDMNQLWKEILRLRGERLRKAVVLLKRSGDFRLVDVVVNQSVPARLLVETRAQYTILSEYLAQQLGIQITPRTSEVHFEFAGRSYTAPVVNLPSLKIGELEVRNIPILVWNLSAYSEIDGILGKSFLKHFQVAIKHDEQVLVLTK